MTSYTFQPSLAEQQRRDGQAELRRQEMIRRRSLTTIPDGVTFKLRSTGPRIRGMLRELNDTVGMNGYELIRTTHLSDDHHEVELVVPGGDLAILLKLTWS